MYPRTYRRLQWLWPTEPLHQMQPVVLIKCNANPSRYALENVEFVLLRRTDTEQVLGFLARFVWGFINSLIFYVAFGERRGSADRGFYDQRK